MGELQSICVFCGSSNGTHPIYRAAALAIAGELVKRDIDLVYGGGSVGLMGITAAAVERGGGQVTGVIPRSLKTKEVAGVTYGDLIVVETMHERKALMAERAQGFVVLPGGFGTLDELFEMVTWGQLGIHQKPIGLLNVQGYFDPLLAWLDQAIDAGFVRPQHRRLLVVATEAGDLLERLVAYEAPPSVIKWLGLAET